MFLLPAARSIYDDEEALMPAEDRYKNFSGGPNSPVNHAWIVSPSDEDDLPFVSNGLFVVGAGAVKVSTRGGDLVTLPALPEGSFGVYWPVFCTRVWDTDTTATTIVGFSI